jgi:hypothetical protein
MQRRGEVDDVGALRAGLEEHAIEPGARALALAGGLDVRVVLDVVADDERGAVGAAASAADALARAEGFDGDAVGEADCVCTQTRFKVQGSKFKVFVRLSEFGIVGELVFEVFEVGDGLVTGIGNDPDVGLAAFQGASEDEGEGDQRGFCAAAGAEDVELLSGGTDKDVRPTVELIELIGDPGVHSGGF